MANTEHKKNPEWIIRGKTIKSLIEELKTFENQELEVKISLDGENYKCISLVSRENENGKYFCGLTNCENME
jgi:hypothetical protein